MTLDHPWEAVDTSEPKAYIAYKRRSIISFLMIVIDSDALDLCNVKSNMNYDSILGTIIYS